MEHTANNVTQIAGGVPPATGLSLFAKVTIALQLIMMVAIIAGNSLVLVTILKFRSLRDVTGLLVCNLAAADLFIGITLPFQILFNYYPQMAKNELACLLRYLTILFSTNASIYSLVCTVVDRYVAIVHPFQYTNAMTTKVAGIMIVCIWTIDLVITGIPLMGVNNMKTAPFCIYPLVMKEGYRLFLTIHNLVFAFLMAVLYVRIFMIARRHVQQIEAINQMPPSGSSSSARKNSQKNTVVAIVVILFHVSWLPYFILQLAMATINQVTKDKIMVSNFLVFLGIANSIANPIVYAWKNKHYRRAFKKTLCLQRNEEDTSTSVVNTIS